MRYIHMWVYFLPEAQEDSDGGYELRLSLDGNIEVALGYKVKPADVAGEWVEYVWEIDSSSSQEDLSAMTGINLSFNPGSEASSGVCYIDQIYASRPAEFPAELEYITVYSFDEEGANAAPVGWQASNGEAYIGIGDITPSEGSNYMEIILGEGWIMQAQTTDAKGATDRWDEAIDLVMDVRVSEEFTGSWLLFNPVVQSGGEDPDGNPLEQVNSWDSYGERAINSEEFIGQWKSIAWPFRLEEHIDALGDNGWFQIILVTNQDAAEAGRSIFVDNFRIAVPSETAIGDWSVF